MLQIGNAIVSFDVLREKFACDLAACKGECCVAGDSGAPITDEEADILRECLPLVWDDLSENARSVIKTRGVAYKDVEGDLVTSIVNNKHCVFTCYNANGICMCALEKAYHEGKTGFIKPLSCHLYPIRLSNYGPYTAVNYNRWNICKAAVLAGRAQGIPLYKALKTPLIRRFGTEWYEELEFTVQEMQRQHLL